MAERAQGVVYGFGDLAKRLAVHESGLARDADCVVAHGTPPIAGGAHRCFRGRLELGRCAPFPERHEFGRSRLCFCPPTAEIRPRASNPMPPTVSIVIPVHNQWAYTIRC